MIFSAGIQWEALNATLIAGSRGPLVGCVFLVRAVLPRHHYGHDHGCVRASVPGAQVSASNLQTGLTVKELNQEYLKANRADTEPWWG